LHKANLAATTLVLEHTCDVPAQRAGQLCETSIGHVEIAAVERERAELLLVETSCLGGVSTASRRSASGD